MKNLIFEGARGLGKSEISRYIRQKTTNSTLINFTGFNEGGQEGLNKVLAYYKAWETFFFTCKWSDALFIHDRYYFSEMVYSELYKDYDFKRYYYQLIKQFEHTFDQAEIVFLWTSRQEDLERNLKRDKAELFGNVGDDVSKSLTQQLFYLVLENELITMKIPNLTVHIVDVAGKTIEEIGEEVLKLTNL
jgi:deoxyguanosine kinase